MENRSHSRPRAFGLAFDNLSFEEAVSRALELADDPRPQFAVTPNVDHIVLIQDDPEMADIYRSADLVLCDGMPLKWALGWLGRPLKEKVSGSDLFPVLCRKAVARRLSIFLLGAAPGVADECARRLKELHPDLKIAGTLSPPPGFDRNPAAQSEAARAVREAAPDLLFVALGTPSQEKFIYRQLHEMNVPLSLGVGAAFDFFAGRAKRAPRWMRRAGLEWLWRLAREPRRLWRRYLLRDSRFIAIAWREWRRRGHDE